MVELIFIFKEWLYNFVKEGVLMQLYNTSQYAIRVLNFIANHSDNRLYSAKELSEVLNIPYKFLTKIMGILVKTGFISSIQGREGGYELNKPASEIKLIDILNTFIDDTDNESCILGIGICDSLNKCALHDQWMEPKSLMRKMFEETTLNNLTCKDCKL